MHLIVKVELPDKLEYRLNSKTGPLHNDFDEPAVIYPNGSKFWYENGKLHRLNGPAGITISLTGNSEGWFKEGMNHRIGGPSYKNSDGTEEWCVEGRRHRIDGPAEMYADGAQEWYLNGLLHREEGPAVSKPDGYEEWRIEGRLHRSSGPAVVWPGGKIGEWHINGTRLTHQESEIAYQILYKLTLEDVMVYIGDPLLCYFVKHRLDQESKHSL